LLRYYDSTVEEALLSTLSEALGPGCKIFVKYHSDKETCSDLAMSVPPVMTRLGYRLFLLGFAWFKDWYFS
jgi:hypothetical protein